MGRRVGNGFVREIAAEGFQAVEFLDGAPVEPLGLGLVAEKEAEAFGLGEVVEAIGEGVVTVLLASDIDIADELSFESAERLVGAAEGDIETAGEEAGFQPRGAKHGLLGDRCAFQRKELLGVDRPVSRDEVGFEAIEIFEGFNSYDDEVGAGEAVIANDWRGRGGFDGRFGCGGAAGDSPISARWMIRHSGPLIPEYHGAKPECETSGRKPLTRREMLSEKRRERIFGARVRR